MDENERKDVNSEETENTSTEEVRAESLDKSAEKESPSVSVSNKKPNLVPIISAIVAVMAIIIVLLIIFLSGSKNSNSNNGDGHIHSFSSWTTVKKANCTEDGVNERYCDCGEKQSQSVSARGHTEVIDNAVAATCITDGKTEGRYCSVCDEVLVVQTTIGRLGHTEVIDSAVAATCTTDGKTEGKHCSVCSETLIAQNNIPASHTDGEWITDADATCTVDGSKHQVCSVCNATIKTETITAKGHDCSETLTSRDCANPAKINYACSQCSYTYEELVKSPKITLEHKGTSSATMNGYGRFSFSYAVTSSDGYGKILYKYELFASSTATVPSSTIDFTEEASVSVSYTGYEDTINEYIYKISAKDEAGNLSICWFKLENCSIIKSEDVSTVEHSYENKICVCGRDITDDTIATYDLSKNQDGSIIGYLTKISGGQKLYILGSGEMKNYSNITSVGHTLTPFKQNENITEINFSDQISSIGSYLFYGCSGITSIEIPGNIKAIGECAFFCTNIETLMLHEGILSIGNSAFDTTDIIELHLPTSIEYIGKDAFENCKITKLYIPKNVSYIGEGAFSYNSKLCQITVDENNSKYHSSNNCIINSSTKTLIVGCKNSTIPSDGSVTHVGAYAFLGNELTSLIIPRSIEAIGDFAFAGCDLTEVVIPISVNTIGYCAFYYSLTTVYCEASSKPSDWDNTWNQIAGYPDKYATVVWGYIE